MPWGSTRPVGTQAKYRTPEHRNARASLKAELKRIGYLICAQPECVMPTRMIMPGDDWHVGHDETGTRIIGPVQARCNVRDGAKRGNARSRGLVDARRWPL